MRRSRPLGVEAPAVLLPWDTEFWGIRIGRASGDRMTAGALQALDAWAADNRVRCVYFLATADDPPTAHVAEGGGFRLMDLRAELRRRVEATPVVGGVREATEQDHERLRAIARGSHGTTRFYADPSFPDERCDELYETWIERSLGGWADAVIVVEHDGTAAGYCSCHVDGSSGSIGLIAVDERVRGAGVGTALAAGAVAWCGSRGVTTMSVVTQGRNIPALRTFHRAGFSLASIDLWFHKWYAP